MNTSFKMVLKLMSGLLLSLLFSFHIQAQKKTNLLFIMTDQQRYDALSIAGNTVIKTPNLDRLAKQGVFPELLRSTKRQYLKKAEFTASSLQIKLVF